MDVRVEGWTDPPPGREVRRWAGQILQVMVDPPRQEGWIPLGAFLRFARVVRVERRPWWRPEACPRCEAKRPRFRLHVEWESGYDEPDAGGVICEACTSGRVVEGGALVTFGGDGLGEMEVSWSLDLQP